MKVLIVDDNEETANGISRLISVMWKIESEELRIVCVKTMAEAIEEAIDSNVTILDLDLPDSEPLASIERIPDFPPPVIVLTGHDDDALTAQCMAAGAAHVFIKGSLIGFIPSFFKSLQQDLLRRAEERYAEAT